MEIAKLVKTALEETRMLILGAQILLGFELSGVFRNGLTDLPLHACLLDGVALLLMVVTVVLIIAPETYHHYVEYDADTRTLSTSSSRGWPLAHCCPSRSVWVAPCSLSGIIGGLPTGAAAGCLFVVLGLGCWYGLPYLRRLQTGNEERRPTVSKA